MIEQSVSTRFHCASDIASCLANASALASDATANTSAPIMTLVIRTEFLTLPTNSADIKNSFQAQEPVGLKCSKAKQRFNLNPARASTDVDDVTHLNEAAHIGNR